ncbi:hypothetical protein BHE74_00034670 [Ensete ventricosum]|nr:hypothetical protein BHE74_00034670 [Ensete ventricosum]
MNLSPWNYTKFSLCAYIFPLHQIRHALESLRRGDGLRFERMASYFCCFFFYQEEYVEGEDLGTLDCGHDFHSVCIKQWLMHKNLCPICKNTALVT